MKIAIITPGTLPLPPVKGGAAETLIELFLKENEYRNDYDITVYSIFDECAAVATKKYSNTKFVFINTKALLFRFGRIVRHLVKRIFKINISSEYLNRIIRDIKKDEFDLIIIENRPDFILNLKNHTKAKIIQHIHNDYLSDQTMLNRKILNYSDNVIVVSEYIKNTLKWYNNTSKIKTLYNGIDVNKFNNNKLDNEVIEFRKELNILQNELVILFTGRLTAQKGVSDLIQAFKANNHKNVKLLIVGSSWYSESNRTPYVMDLIEQAEGINEKIIFTGYIDYDKMPVVYKSADIVVISSAGVEAAGLVALEARASGKPVISSDSGGLPEYIDNKGIIISRDKRFVENLSIVIEELINKKELRALYSLQSLIDIEKFGKCNYYDNFKTILINEINRD